MINEPMLLPTQKPSPHWPDKHAIRLKRILVPTDFSDASREALPYAVNFARQFGATLTLVHVLPPLLPADPGQSGIFLEPEHRAREGSMRLARFREDELPPDLPIAPVVLEGDTAQQITRLAEASETDLILISTHGYTGLKHVWLGSRAERIVRHAHCPVLVVRHQPVPLRFPESTACRFRRILVPTDFSAASRKAMAYGAALARPCEGQVTLLHVIEPPPYPEFGYAHIPIKEAKQKKAARQVLDLLAQELADPSLGDAPVIRTGNASHEITEQARQQTADLIVIATHGRNGLAHAVLGSTAERVVRHAPCPVLVVRAREHEFLV